MIASRPRRLLVPALLASLLVGGPPAAAAELFASVSTTTRDEDAFIGRVDRAELASALADDREAQDVCYGWRIVVRDASGGPSYVDEGSNAGPYRDVSAARCPRWLRLAVFVDYTSESSESEDSARVVVESSLPRPPTSDDLVAAGVTGSRLKGDDGDQALIDAMDALPLLVARNGNAPYVPFEQARDVPAQDRPAGDPGDDWLRATRGTLFLFGFVIVAGVALVVAALYKRATLDPSSPSRRRRRRRAAHRS